MLARLRLPLLLAAVIAASGCDSGGPDSLADAAGDYRAARFVITGVGGEGSQSDFLALGGTFTLSIADDGRFTSRLALAEGTALSEDGALDDTVDGTVLLRSGGVVQFVHNEDYFLRDLRWTYEDGTIRSDPEPLFTGIGYDVVLQR